MNPMRIALLYVLHLALLSVSAADAPGVTRPPLALTLLSASGEDRPGKYLVYDDREFDKKELRAKVLWRGGSFDEVVSRVSKNGCRYLVWRDQPGTRFTLPD